MGVDVFLLGLIAASLVLVFLGFPLAFALAITAVAYLVINDFPLSLAVQQLAFAIDKYTFIAVPLFMAAGMLMNAARITDRIFDFANLLVGRIPGGLGHVNVVASIIFAGMSGSVLADVAGLGSMEYKAMREKGYRADFAIGVTLASSAIGPIFPPSVPMVLFGVIAEVSIVGLFLGGLLPGILIALCLMLYVLIVGIRHGYVSPVVFSPKRIAIAFIIASPALFTPVIIVGGMTLGIFSPTEAATVAVLWGLFIAFVLYRDLTLRQLFAVSREVAISVTRLLFIITSALLFGWVLTVGELPQQVAIWTSETFDDAWAFLLLLNVTLLILGAIIENAILLLILAPMIVPIAETHFGIDPIHLGVVMVFNIMIGQYTPPMGLSLFIMRDITGFSLGRVSLAVAPFLIPLIAALFLMTYLPWIVLTVPRAAGF